MEVRREIPQPGSSPALFGVGNPRILTLGPVSEAVRDEETRINVDSGFSGTRVHLDSETALAYDLVEERYGVDMHRLIEEAPMLFTLLSRSEPR